MLLGPHPRFRTYSHWTSYVRLLSALTVGEGGRNAGAIGDLEHDLAEFAGTAHAIATPQNRVGIYLVLRHLLTPGQEVIMSPYTIADITNMVILAGGRPVFADIDRATCNIAADSVERCFSSRTGAVLVTHLHGLSAELGRLGEMCRARGIPMVEDAAQALGTRFASRRVGSHGTAGVYSFGMYKNVSGFLGGAVVTDDGELAAALRRALEPFGPQPAIPLLLKLAKGALSDVLTSPSLFRTCVFWVFRYGMLHDVEAINRRVRTELDTSPKARLPESYEARMRPTQAQIVVEQLPGIDAASEVRMRAARSYHEGLNSLDGILLPPLRTDGSHIYTYFPVQVPDREAFLKFLAARNRDIGAQHYKNNADLPGFQEFARDCPNAAAVAEQLVFLPTYPRYPMAEVAANVAVIREYFAS